MFQTRRLAMIPHKSFLLCLIILQAHLIHSVTVNPNHDESTTAVTQRNWKASFHRNNKEIKFIPTHKESKKVDIELPAIKEDASPLSKTHQYGQRKQNLENSPAEDIKAKRGNLLSSYRSRNSTKLDAIKESNKIDIILLPQDETDVTTKSTLRRRYRKNKNRQHHRSGEKHAEDANVQKENEEKSEQVKESEKTSGTIKNETTDDLPINRLFNKNKRRLYGNRHNVNKVHKEETQVNEKQSGDESVEHKTEKNTNVEEEVKIQTSTAKVEKENSYKIDLNEKTGDSEKYGKEHKKHHSSKHEPTPEYIPTEESAEESPAKKEKEYEKNENLIQKYRVPTVSTISTPIEIVSSYPSSNYYDNKSYNKMSQNGLSNMQLLHTLGMRKVRQPNHHNKRHQQDSKSKSRSQYNINSDSQMYIVKLPPQPYYYLNEKSSYNSIKPKNNLPIKMVNNGKIDKVYHYNLPLVEKLMTGRKTYNNKGHKIHDPVQSYFGPYSQNEYDSMTKKPVENKKPFVSNKKYDSESSSGNYFKSEAAHDHKKVIPVHEDSSSFEESDKQLDTRHDHTSKFSVRDDYTHFDPSDAYKKFDAQEHYKRFNEKSEFDKFNPTDDFKSFDTKYDFEKFKPANDYKAFDSTDDFNKFKPSKPFSYNKGSKGPSHQDSKIINLKTGLNFGSSPSMQYDGNAINDKTYQSFSDKNYRHYDRVMTSSVAPIYMKPYVHRYYTNNGRPKSIYVLPQYHKT